MSTKIAIYNQQQCEVPQYLQTYRTYFQYPTFQDQNLIFLDVKQEHSVSVLSFINTEYQTASKILVKEHPIQVLINAAKLLKIDNAIIVDIGLSVRFYKMCKTCELIHHGRLGAGAVQGLMNLFGITQFQEFGDPQQVDLTVADIYGGPYEAQNLPGHMVAGYMAKSVKFDGLEKELVASLGQGVMVNTVRTAEKLRAIHGGSLVVFSGRITQNQQFRQFLDQAIVKFVKCESIVTENIFVYGLSSI